MNRLTWIATAAFAATSLASAAQAQRGPDRGPPDAPQRPAADERYRATGTEPFWALEIERGQMSLRTPEGVVAQERRPDPRPSPNGLRYQGRRMTVDITYAPCTDGMSDRRYPHRVTVQHGRRTYRGCGGEADRVERPVFEGDWRMLTVAGRPVDARRPGNLTFERGRVTGSTGCNTLSGSYRMERGRLVVGPLALTKMACPGPIGRQEQAVVSILAKPLAATTDRRGRLVLTAAGGREIVLQGARR